MKSSGCRLLTNRRFLLFGAIASLLQLTFMTRRLYQAILMVGDAQSIIRDSPQLAGQSNTFRGGLNMTSTLCTPDTSSTDHVRQYRFDRLKSLSEKMVVKRILLGNNTALEQGALEDSSAMSGMKSHESPYVICEFVNRKGYAHFPHTLEQLYPCFSYWRQHNAAIHNPSGRKEKFQPLPKTSPITKQAVLVQRFASMRERTFQQNKQPPKSFVPGLKQALQEVFQVQILDDYPTLPSNVKLESQHSFWQEVVTMEEDEDQPYYVEDPQDMMDLRNGILDHYFGHSFRLRASSCHSSGLAANNTDIDRGHVSIKPRVGILNRNETRSLLNVQDIVGVVKDYLGEDTSVTVALFENADFLSQVDFFAQHDIVLSPHGAQLVGIPFLPSCASLLEIFPKGYWVPSFFASLAQISNHSIRYLYLGGPGKQREEELEELSKDPPTRMATRKRSLCPPLEKIQQGLVQVVQDWQQCCGYNG